MEKSRVGYLTLNIRNNGNCCHVFSVPHRTKPFWELTTRKWLDKDMLQSVPEVKAGKPYREAAKHDKKISVGTLFRKHVH